MSLHRSCCCGDSPNAVLLTGYFACFDFSRAIVTWSDPTDPAEWSEEAPPPCDLPEVTLPACSSYSCSRGETGPGDTQILCPNGIDLDAPRPWGTTTTWDYGTDTYWYSEDGLTLPYVSTTTDTGNAADYYLPAPGSGTVQLVSSGIVEAEIDLYEDVLSLMPPCYEADPECLEQYDCTPSDRTMRAEFKHRSTWSTPPCAIQLLADAVGTSVEVTATQLIVTRSGPTTDTFTLASDDLDALFTWLDGKGLTPYDHGGAGTMNANMGQHPSTLLVVMADTTVPTSGTKLRLAIVETGAEAVNPGTYDASEALEPTWTVSELNDTGVTTYVSVAVGYALFDGSERGFANGIRADFDDAWQEWISDDCEQLTADGNIYPTFGPGYSALAFVPVSSAPSRVWCTDEVVSDTGPSWDQDIGDCWVACVAGRSKTKNGNDVLWQLQRIVA